MTFILLLNERGECYPNQLELDEKDMKDIYR